MVRKIRLTSKQKNCLYNNIEPLADEAYLEGRKRDSLSISRTLERMAKSDFGKTSTVKFTNSQFDTWIEPHLGRCKKRR